MIRLAISASLSAFLGSLLAGALLLLWMEKRVEPANQAARYWKATAGLDVQCQPHAQIPELVGFICPIPKAEANGAASSSAPDAAAPSE